MEICHCMGMYNKKHAPLHAKIILSCCLTGIYINSYNTVLSTHHFNTRLLSYMANNGHKIPLFNQYEYCQNVSFMGNFLHLEQY